VTLANHILPCRSDGPTSQEAIPLHPEREKNPRAKRPKAKHADNDAMVKAAWEQGWWCEMVKKGYIHAKSPDGKTMVVIESTPSDSRSVANTRSRLRRAGLKL
jgi:hypothetical protein